MRCTAMPTRALAPLVAFAVLLASAHAAAAQTPVDPAAGPQVPPPSTSAASAPPPATVFSPTRGNVMPAFKDLFTPARDLKNLFTHSNLWVVAIGAGGTAAMLPFDHRAAHA